MLLSRCRSTTKVNTTAAIFSGPNAAQTDTAAQADAGEPGLDQATPCRAAASLHYCWGLLGLQLRDLRAALPHWRRVAEFSLHVADVLA